MPGICSVLLNLVGHPCHCNAPLLPPTRGQLDLDLCHLPPYIYYDILIESMTESLIVSTSKPENALYESTKAKNTPHPEVRIKTTTKPRRSTLQPTEGEDPRTSRAHGRREEDIGQLPMKPSFITLSYFPSITCTDKAKPEFLRVELYTVLFS